MGGKKSGKSAQTKAKGENYQGNVLGTCQDNVPQIDEDSKGLDSQKIEDSSPGEGEQDTSSEGEQDTPSEGEQVWSYPESLKILPGKIAEILAESGFSIKENGAERRIEGKDVLSAAVLKTEIRFVLIDGRKFKSAHPLSKGTVYETN